jgi:AraC-like DNA-binding protein
MPQDPGVTSLHRGLRTDPNGPSQRRALERTRPSTAALRSQAVERVVATMRQRLDEPMPLDAMAEVAMLSRYHFARVFQRVTGLPPARFLTTLRLAEAKRLLLTTSLNVTDICFRVGYNSLGSFTVRFTQSVGVSPGRFRQLRRHCRPIVLGGDHRQPAERQRANFTSPSAEISGRVYASSALAGPVFVGLFRTSVPEGAPVRCAILPGAGAYRMPQVPEGAYHVLAASFPWPDDGPAPLLPDGGSLQVGASRGVVRVAHGEALRGLDLWLRPTLPTDPPVLVALPALLARQ